VPPGAVRLRRDRVQLARHEPQVLRHAAQPARGLARMRIGALDAIRGAAVAVMILVHCLAFFASARLQTEGVGHVIMELGKLTAVFAVAMGFSTAFSRRAALAPAL